MKDVSKETRTALNSIYERLKDELLAFDAPDCLTLEVTLYGVRHLCYVLDGFDSKLHYSMDFTEGENYRHSKGKTPINCLFASSSVIPFERKFDLMHEAIETFLMRWCGMTYDEAHEIANSYERAYRLEYRNRRPKDEIKYFKLHEGELVRE